MQLALYSLVGVAAAVAIDAYLPAPLPATQGSGLAGRLIGTWHGSRTTPISIKPETFTVTWRKTPDGHLAGTVTVPGQPKYAVNVVWSSDTAFIYESAAHMSQLLHHKVVTRSVAHFKGEALQGTFEARPTTYEGKTTTGNFTATRSA